MNFRNIKMILFFNKICKSILPLPMYWRVSSYAKKILIKESWMLSYAKRNPKKIILPLGATDNKDENTGQSIQLFFNKQSSCKLVICCAFTGRHQMLASAIHESFQSNYGESIEWVLCGTTDEDKLFIESMQKTTGRVSGLMSPNKPLGQKWQNCISFAGQYYNAELYSIFGSDDLASSKLIDHIITLNDFIKSKTLMKKPSLYATINWITLVRDPSNFTSPQIFECKILNSSYFQPIGAGRFYTREFLNKVNFEIFDVNLNRLLDDLGYQKILQHNETVHMYSAEEGPLISVKGSWSQLNSVKDFFDAEKLEMKEFSFRGYDLIKKSCSEATCDYLLKQNDLMQQLSFPTSSNKELMQLSLKS